MFLCLFVFVFVCLFVGECVCVCVTGREIVKERSRNGMLMKKNKYFKNVFILFCAALIEYVACSQVEELISE